MTRFEAVDGQVVGDVDDYVDVVADDDRVV